MRQKLLLLTGIPGTGKTEAGHSLVKRGFVHLDAELHAASRPISTMAEWIALWEAFLQTVDSAKRAGKNVAITWGFMPGVDDGTIGRLQQLGFQMVWFDGDRTAARREFLKRGTVSEDLLDAQLERIATLDLASFTPTPFNPFDGQGQFFSKEAIAQQLLEL